MDLMKTL